MTYILLEVGIVLRFCCIWTEVSAKGELFERNITLTWNESLKYCQDIGKVLFDVKESKSWTILRNILNDTDQTWVSATVEFSHFVNVPVCMETNNQLIANKTFDTDIIGNCLKFCKGYLYAGLKDRDCFCFKDARNLTRSKRCNSTCNNDPVHQCGGNESISLYEKADKDIIRYIDYGYKECVYAKKTGQVTNLFTGSCVGQVADGAICEGGNRCRQRNWTWFEESLCHINLSPPITWMQTNKYCTDIGGKLMNEKIWEKKWRENSTYSFGSYRIPMIHKAEAMQRINNDTICAVARRAGDLVLIEGEDCFTKHAILCEDEEYPERTASSGTDHIDKSGPRTNENSAKTDKSGPRTKEKLAKTDNTIIYVVIAVLTVLLLALVFVFLMFVKRKRQQHLNPREMPATECTSEQNTVIQMRAHNEPEPGQGPYENIVPVRNEQSLTVPQPGQSSSAQTEYERLHTQEERNKENDLHFYDQLMQH